jgi:hypothetical protein
MQGMNFKVQKEDSCAVQLTPRLNDDIINLIINIL